MKKSRRSIAAILAATIVCHQPMAYAGWVDDWLQSKTSTSPGYFEGQARGYATAGSFSARWPSRTDYPISVQAPRLSAGCGGIDFFGGSVSFLNADQIVQKLQRILQNSAGVAFDMALDTLCPKCSAIMKSMEDLSDKLNSMAMNDCQAAKGLVTGLRPVAEGVAESFKEGMSSEAVENGFTDSYSYFKNQLPSVPTAQDVQSWFNSKKGAASTTNPNTTGCSGILADLFPADNSQYPVSVMSKVGTDIGLPQDYVNLMRGLAGDVRIFGVDHGYDVEYEGPCERNADLDLDQFKTGDIDQMDENGVCTQAVATHGNLEQYVATTMQSVSDKLKTSTALGSSETAFITNVPVAVLYGMRVAVGSGQEASMIASLSGITATAWMEKSLQDLLSRTSAIMRVASKASTNFVNGRDDCNLAVFGDSFKTQQKDMMAAVNRVSGVLNNSMAGQFHEFESTMSLARHLEDINSQIRGQVARNFGPSVAARVTRGL